ncbi:uncharacterized protein LOC143659704 [Tamandua tetradactyla]|uniref:uncharacterized protein LOC143659704 n=1 Tax=Tamandua tetradactyla TaxID=48850 RepID=UPI0040543D18
MGRRRCTPVDLLNQGQQDEMSLELNVQNFHTLQPISMSSSCLKSLLHWEESCISSRVKVLSQRNAPKIMSCQGGPRWFNSTRNRTRVSSVASKNSATEEANFLLIPVL